MSVRPTRRPSVPEALNGACNNGHEAYWGFFEPSGPIGMFTGLDPVADFLHPGSGDGIFINAAVGLHLNAGNLLFDLVYCT